MVCSFVLGNLPSRTRRGDFAKIHFVPSTVVLNVSLLADDFVDVFLNGNLVFTHPNTAMYLNPSSFAITTGFVAGTNTLDFVVNNVTGGGPTGLNALITGNGSSSSIPATPIPPSVTLTLVGIALIGAYVFFQKRRMAR